MARVEDITEEEPVELRRRQPRDGQGTSEVATTEDGEAEDVPEREVITFNEQVDRARAQYQPTAMEKFMAIVKSIILRALVIYFLMTFLRGSSNTAKNTTAETGSGKVPAPASLASTNIYPNGTEFDMYVYITESIDRIKNFSNAQLIWKQEGLIYGDWYGGPSGDGTFSQSVQLPVSKKVQNNGTLCAHTFLVLSGMSPDPTIRNSYSKSHTMHAAKQLNKYKKKKYTKTHNLLTGETTASLEHQEKAKTISSEVVSHWHPNMTIGLVTDWTAWTMGAVPAPLNEFIKFIPDQQRYQPIVFYNEYWNLLKDYQPINETTPVLSFVFTFQPLSLFKWQIYAAQSMRNQWQASFLVGQEDDEDDQDTLKEAFLDTNPYLLALTFAVSILHSVFEFLAFKNDIQFWNNRKSLEGLSVRSVFFNVFQSLIVLLYVLDNETNFVIKISVFIGLLIEMWKINKVMDVKLDRDNPVMGIIPRIKFLDKGSYVESSTRQYDLLAFKYLSWVLFPLLLGYAVYSLLYVEQKGWYSWVLSMLYGFLLTFGFIMMTPQLFINYKLKSVAHLPWRMLSYKFLNTFIDDIFAFVIKMPTMYRIGCLRDDVIFFIYLYQRWIYRTDLTRLNEFGYSGEMLEDSKKAKNNENNGNPAIEPTAEGVKNGPVSNSSTPGSPKINQSQSPKKKSKASKKDQ